MEMQDYQDNAKKLRPDPGQARRFLLLLDEEAERFCFQTFDDNKARKDGALASIKHGDLESCGKELWRLNKQGAGVFVTVNDTDGEGRRIQNITRVRAVWHEEDQPTGITVWPLEPHIIVESSPGKYHRYWLVDGMSKEQHAMVMARMVREYGSDPNARDVARVLRLPGFLHQKNPASPFLVRIVAESGALPYTAAEILSAFPPLGPESDKPYSQPQSDSVLPAQKVREIRSALSFVDPTPRDNWLRIGMALHSTGAGQQAFGLWDEWSQKTGQNNYNPKDQRKHWDDDFGKYSGGRIISLATLFDMAQSGGWVRPSDAKQTAPDDNVIPLSMATLRRELSDLIESTPTEDFERLTVTIAQKVLQSELAKPAQEFLLAQIARKAKVPKASLGRVGVRAGKVHRDSVDDAIKELNSKHAVVPYGGKVLILNKEFDPALKRTMYTYSNRSDFDLRYANRRVWNGEDEVSIAEHWIVHPKRREFAGVVFAPGESAPAGYLNLFTGFGVVPELGYCRLFLDFFHDIICGGDDQLHEYLLCWCAHLFQKPDELPGTAPVLRGQQGIGKNTFVDALGVLVGNAHFLTVSSLQQVTGRFSAHLSDVLLLFANEAIWGGDKSAEGALKAMVTDPVSTMERKHADIVPVRNYKRMILASNENWVVPRGLDDRRFFIIDVSAERKEDREYFAAIRAELENGGYAALLHYLLSIDIRDWSPTPIPKPMMQTGWELKIRSGGSVVQWWFECLDYGYHRVEQDTEGSEYPRWYTELGKKDAHGLYLKWCEQHRNLHPELDCMFSKWLFDWGVTSRRSRASGRTPQYVFPTLDEARRIFSEKVGIPMSYWGDSEGDG